MSAPKRALAWRFIARAGDVNRRNEGATPQKWSNRIDIARGGG